MAEKRSKIAALVGQVRKNDFLFLCDSYTFLSLGRALHINTTSSEPPERSLMLYSHHSTRSFTALFLRHAEDSDRPPRNRPQERQVGAGAPSCTASARPTLGGAALAAAVALDDHSRRR